MITCWVMNLDPMGFPCSDRVAHKSQVTWMKEGFDYFWGPKHAWGKGRTLKDRTQGPHSSLHISVTGSLNEAQTHSTQSQAIEGRRENRSERYEMLGDQRRDLPDDDVVVVQEQSLWAIKHT